MPRLNQLKKDLLDAKVKLSNGKILDEDGAALSNKAKQLRQAIDNFEDNPIVIGCNYHTQWQANKAMRFVLKDVKGNRARLITRRTKKDFWTDIKDLIYIDSQANRIKYKQKLIKDGK
jgi:hypothetical protein